MSELVIRPDADLVLASIVTALDQAGPDQHLRLVLRSMVEEAKVTARAALIAGDVKSAAKALTAAVSADAALAVVMFLGPEKLVLETQEELVAEAPDPEPDGDGEGDPGAAQGDGPEVVLENMNRAELLAHAKELGLKGLSQCTKEDILATIQDALDSTEPDDNES